MARSASLTSAAPAGWRRWAMPASLVLLVLAAHWLALRWIAQYAGSPTALRSMPEALFTRVLAPEAPPPPPEAPVLAAAPPAPARPAITTLQAPTTVAVEPSSAAVAPVEAAEAPVDQPQPSPQPPPPPQEPPEVARAPAPPSSTAAPEAPAAAAPAQPEPAAVDAGPTTTAAAATTATTAAPASGAGQDPAAPDLWPRDSRINYALTGQFRGPLYGSAQVQWQREGPRYQARVTLSISLAGTRTLTSQGEVTPAGLLPRVYEETWRGKRRHVRLDDRQLVFETGNTAPRPEGVQDTASQFVELGWRFASGRERLEAGRTIDVWLARPGAVDLWTYDIVGRERLDTPKLGVIEAYRLKPRPIARPRGNITAEIWFAPSLQYLPARIRVTLGEETWVDLVVESIEQR